MLISKLVSNSSLLYSRQDLHILVYLSMCSLYIKLSFRMFFVFVTLLVSVRTNYGYLAVCSQVPIETPLGLRPLPIPIPGSTTWCVKIPSQLYASHLARLPRLGNGPPPTEIYVRNYYAKSQLPGLRPSIT